MSLEYKVLRLGGRCLDGAQRDAGFRCHAVPVGDYKAVCGATYGRMSGGWFDAQPQESVSCPRCLKKLKPDSKRVEQTQHFKMDRA